MSWAAQEGHVTSISGATEEPRDERSSMQCSRTASALKLCRKPRLSDAFLSSYHCCAAPRTMDVFARGCLKRLNPAGSQYWISVANSPDGTSGSSHRIDCNGYDRLKRLDQWETVHQRPISSL